MWLVTPLSSIANKDGYRSRLAKRITPVHAWSAAKRHKHDGVTLATYGLHAVVTNVIENGYGLDRMLANR